MQVSMQQVCFCRLLRHFITVISTADKMESVSSGLGHAIAIVLQRMGPVTELHVCDQVYDMAGHKRIASFPHQKNRFVLVYFYTGLCAFRSEPGMQIFGSSLQAFSSSNRDILFEQSVVCFFAFF